MNDERFFLVLSNFPDRESACRVAELLIENHLAACVNILAECSSIYRWQGKVESASEIPVLIKTSRSAYPLLQEIIRKHHPYELPEIIAVSIETGLPSYLHWLMQETTQCDQHLDSD